MNTKEFSIKYSVSQFDLESFIVKTDLKYKKTMFSGIEILDDPEVVLKAYKEYSKEKEEDKRNKESNTNEKELSKQKMHESQKVLEQQINQVIITTTPTLSDYKVIKYSGLVSATGHVTGFNTDTDIPPLISKVEQKLKEAAFSKGCNAVIGASFSTIMSGALVTVTAYGTAIKAHKE